MRLQPPLRVAEVAALLGWTYKRTKRWLLDLRRDKGLELVGGGQTRQPITVTLAALYRACPDLFEPPPGLENRVDELEDRIQSGEQERVQMATVIGVLRKRLDGAPKALARVA